MVHFAVAPDAPAVRFSDVTLASGLRLRYAEQGPADGPAVLMLHGTSDSSFSFSRVMPLLPGEWRVVAIDQRGHGDSDRPETGYAIEDFALDALEVLDRLSIRRATVVGHCMGSFIARCLARLAPSRIERLVLIGVGPTLRNDAVREVAAAAAAMESAVDPAFVRAFQESTCRLPVPPAFMEQVIAESLKMPPRVWKAVLAAMLQHVTADHEITTETLILGGELDAVFSVAEQHEVARTLPGARIRLFPGVGHALHWEAPELFAAALSTT